MSWVLVAVTAWLLCSVLGAVLIGRSIGLADRKAAEAAAGRAEDWPGDALDPEPAGAEAPSSPRESRRAGTSGRTSVVGGCVGGRERIPFPRAADHP